MRLRSYCRFRWKAAWGNSQFIISYELVRNYSGGVWIRGYMVGCEGEGGEFWDWVGELCVVWGVVWASGVVFGDGVARGIFFD